MCDRESNIKMEIEYILTRSQLNHDDVARKPWSTYTMSTLSHKATGLRSNQNLRVESILEWHSKIQTSFQIWQLDVKLDWPQHCGIETQWLENIYATTSKSTARIEHIIVFCGIMPTRQLKMEHCTATCNRRPQLTASRRKIGCGRPPYVHAVTVLRNYQLLLFGNTRKTWNWLWLGFCKHR